MNPNRSPRVANIQKSQIRNKIMKHQNEIHQKLCTSIATVWNSLFCLTFWCLKFLTSESLPQKTRLYSSDQFRNTVLLCFFLSTHQHVCCSTGSFVSSPLFHFHQKVIWCSENISKRSCQLADHVEDKLFRLKITSIAREMIEYRNLTKNRTQFFIEKSSSI